MVPNKLETMNNCDTIVLADAHLDGENAELDHFIAFLAELRAHEIRALYLLGDMCNIWLGTPKMQLPYHEPLLAALHELRDAGTRLHYVEGNRDYFLAHLYLHNPFHDIASDFLEERLGQIHIYFSHGDLVNMHDRQYHVWRRFSRNPVLFSVVNVLPQSFLIHLIHSLERKFRMTNSRHRTTFPQDTCRQYAERLWQKGYDLILLGHFHEQHYLRSSESDTSKILYTLPAWKDTHDYLCLSSEGTPSFHRF